MSPPTKKDDWGPGTSGSPYPGGTDPSGYQGDDPGKDGPQPVAAWSGHDTPDLEERWDGRDYSVEEIVPDSPNPLDRLAAQYDAFGMMTEETARALSAAVPEKWTGEAATAYQTYLKKVQEHLGKVSTAAGTAAKAAKTCRQALTDARADAGHAADKCNEARRQRQRDKKKAWYNPEKYTSNADYHLDMWAGLRKGREAQKDARQALRKLVNDLDGTDATLAALRLPKPADPSTIEDPAARALFEAITAPVGKAFELNGDTKRAQDWLAKYNKADSPADRKKLLAQAAKDMTPEELAFLFNSMDEDDVANLFATLNPNKDRAIYNQLAGKLPLDVLIRLADVDPNHYWHPKTGTDDYAWATPSGDPLTAGKNTDLAQGGLGDCYFLSALGAVTARDPDFLKNHVKKNDNGTYTVTMYKDGKEVEITVTPDLPFMTTADGEPWAPGYTHSEDDKGVWGGDATLFQIYEKAMAQAQGELSPGFLDGSGYSGMEGDDPDNYLPTITGKDSDWASPAVVGADQIKKAIADGRPVTVSTWPDAVAGTMDIYDEKREPHLIGGHAYYVTDINTDVDPPTVTVANPWGQQSKTDGTVTMSWDDYQKYTKAIAVGGKP